MLKNNYVKPFKINELLSYDKYIIPIYQRNYAWGDKEISLLIQDLEMLVKNLKTITTLVV